MGRENPGFSPGFIPHMYRKQYITREPSEHISRKVAGAIPGCSCRRGSGWKRHRRNRSIQPVGDQPPLFILVPKHSEQRHILPFQLDQPGFHIHEIVREIQEFPVDHRSLLAECQVTHHERLNHNSERDQLEHTEVLHGNAVINNQVNRWRGFIGLCRQFLAPFKILHSAREFYETGTAEYVRDEIAQITEIQARGVIIRFCSIPKSRRSTQQKPMKNRPFCTIRTDHW